MQCYLFICGKKIRWPFGKREKNPYAVFFLDIRIALTIYHLFATCSREYVLTSEMTMESPDGLWVLLPEFPKKISLILSREGWKMSFRP